VEAGPEPVAKSTPMLLSSICSVLRKMTIGLRIIKEIRAEPQLRAFPSHPLHRADELEPVLRKLESWRVPVLRKPFRIGDLSMALETVISGAARRF